MVKYDVLIKIIENYVTKCYTLADIRSRLEQYDKEHKEDFDLWGDIHRVRLMELERRDLLNPLEWEDFEDILTHNPYEKLDELLFRYERRIVEGLKTNDPPQIDRSDFQLDTQIGYIGTKNDLGYIESKQMESEQNFLKDIDDGIINSVKEYYAGNLNKMNNYIIFPKGYRELFSADYCDKLKAEYKKYGKDIDYVLDNNDGLIENIVLYRGGVLEDISLNVGDHTKFRGYTSTSFQEDVGEYWQGDAFLYKIYAPKGTKGICANNDRFSNEYKDEHEYLLARGTGYTVLSINYEDRIVEIVLDDPNG